mgnify:CR=1 FL=1
MAGWTLARISNGRVEFRFYGGAAEFARYHGGEALIHGPAETGKTISALWKLHLCALKYPNASLVIARKTQASIYGTVLRTYTEKAVSYTHLRAHETPEHLVCRLLPEKKNTTHLLS